MLRTVDQAAGDVDSRETQVVVVALLSLDGGVVNVPPVILTVALTR